MAPMPRLHFVSCQQQTRKYTMEIIKGAYYQDMSSRTLVVTCYIMERILQIIF